MGNLQKKNKRKLQGIRVLSAFSTVLDATLVMAQTMLVEIIMQEERRKHFVKRETEPIIDNRVMNNSWLPKREMESEALWRGQFN